MAAPTDDISTGKNDSRKEKIKKKIAGIVYFSKIPKFMSVKILRDILSGFGEVERIFLQPDVRARISKRGLLFTEGWIEFHDKCVAKHVALALNNNQVGGKRRSPWYDEIWNVKYLHRFKWTHLNERLAYEKAVRQQRMRTEIAQVKRETNAHKHNMEISDKLKIVEKKKRQKGLEFIPGKARHFYMNETEDEIIDRKWRKLDSESGSVTKSDDKSKKLSKGQLNKKAVGSKTSFLGSLFSGGVNGSVADDT